MPYLIELTDEQIAALAQILDAAQITGASARLLVSLQDAVNGAEVKDDLAPEGPPQE